MTAGLVIDLFAGGGGASVGIEAALGRPVDLAGLEATEPLATITARDHHALAAATVVRANLPAGAAEAAA